MLSNVQIEILKDYLDASYDARPFMIIHAIKYGEPETNYNLYITYDYLDIIDGKHGRYTEHTEVYDKQGKRVHDLEFHFEYGSLFELPEELQLSAEERDRMMEKLKTMVDVFQS